MNEQVGAPMGMGGGGGMRHSGRVRFNFRPYPWWGYNYGWPWYGQQQPCYFDPMLGAWVCPSSPWIYRPQIQTWNYRPAPFGYGY